MLENFVANVINKLTVKNFQLYVDMDGVLADFDRAVLDNFGYYPHEVGDTEMTFRVVNHKDFWLNIPPMKDMRQLWTFVKVYNPFILTATANWDRERCMHSKPEWIKRHLPDFDISRLKLVRRSEKASFAASNAILIDDYSKNIIEWREAGGIPIHHRNADLTILELKAMGFDGITP